jgi:hypothetical protein
MNTKFQSENLKEYDHLKDLVVDVIIVLKCDLMKILCQETDGIQLAVAKATLQNPVITVINIWAL